jgi:putative tributyrin esterase
MGILRFNYRSQCLSGNVDITVTIPNDGFSYYSSESPVPQLNIPGRKPPAMPRLVPGMKFQTVYLLHGGGDDDTIVYRHTLAETYARERCVMLVTPCVVNSFGADAAYGAKYMTFITEELPVVIQTLFPSSPRKEDNFIMGFAMGGNAALGCAILHPDRYAQCVDISGGIGFTPRTELLAEELVSEHFTKNFPLYCHTFGPAETLAGSQYDLAAAIRARQAAGLELPKLRMVVGSKEFIFDRVKGDYDALKALGTDVELIIEPDGDHDFKLWDKYIHVALTDYFPLLGKPIYP